MTVDRARLQHAYEHTSYRVLVPDAPFDLRIGEVSAPLHELLLRHAAATWAFVTACNPGSRRLPEADNHRRHADLMAAVQQAGHANVPGIGIGDEPGWPPEPSLLVLGIGEQAAMSLGRRFGQNAIVAGAHDGAPRLLWL